MNKLQAFLNHFAISATVVGAVFAVIWFLWYPAPLFQVLGAWNIIRVLVAVDLVLGPLLTAIVYRPGKPGLKFDISVIAAIQLAALLYGVTAIYAERPCYMVFAVDRFEALSCKLIDGERVAARKELEPKPLRGPLYVLAELPADPAERNRLLVEVMFEGKPDLPHRVEYWKNFAGEALEQIRRRAFSLQASGLAAPLLERARSAAGPDAMLLPMAARDDLVTLVVDPDTLKPVASLPVDVTETANTAGAE
jgi:hypothetical protein